MTKHLLVLSTGQHVGKTTLSLGLVKSLQAKFQGTRKQVAYCKPVGQQHVAVGGGLRDAFLFKEHFGLVQDYKDMSPVIFPDGFTRDFIDGKVTPEQLMGSIRVAHKNLYQQSDFLICEGTGHTGVGSICELNNAQVAAQLKIDAVCVALGGLGSSFDQLAMNRELLRQNNVRLRGVILNKVNPKKMDMIQPLLGLLPFVTQAMLRSQQHSGREDVIDAIIGNQEVSTSHGTNLMSGLILTGWNPPSAELAQRLDADNIPCIYVSPDKADSYTLTARISSFTAKIRREDVARIDMAADHVSKHCDFSFLDG
ncbi:hypothetical protein BBJ28_00005061 [Nothophytophthora sp. Chile5]|nr:hypothetical protein BBJ28_00005061 [Nothophytophthora sp. Chile5]